MSTGSTHSGEKSRKHLRNSLGTAKLLPPRTYRNTPPSSAICQEVLAAVSIMRCKSVDESTWAGALERDADRDRMEMRTPGHLYTSQHKSRPVRYLIAKKKMVSYPFLSKTIANYFSDYWYVVLFHTML